MTVTPVNFTASGAVRLVPGTLMGYTVRETAGTDAVVNVYDNTSAATGALLATIGLGPKESRDINFDRGRTASNGIYVEVSSGSNVLGSLMVAP